jgi:hypothetical protein
LAVLATPASAAPPGNDNYLSAAAFNQPGTVLPLFYANEPVVESTAEATRESQIYPGVTEPDECDFPDGRRSLYGKTVWFDFHPNVSGQLTVVAAGFDAVLALVRYKSTADAQPLGYGACFDKARGTATETGGWYLRRGFHYSVQVGGWAGYLPTATDPNLAASGNLELTYRFRRNTDDDGLYDDQDDCPTAAGPSDSARHGCPDRDSDLVPDGRDQCASTPGLGRYLGCPDADHDGQPENGRDDHCPGEGPSTPGFRDANGNGCADQHRLSSGVFLKNRVFFKLSRGRYVRAGLKPLYLRLAPAPKGATATITCAPRRACRRLRKRASKGRVLIKHGLPRRLKPGTRLHIRITKSGWIGRYISVKVLKGDYKVEKTRCTYPGRTSLLRSCPSLT